MRCYRDETFAQKSLCIGSGLQNNACTCRHIYNIQKVLGRNYTLAPELWRVLWSGRSLYKPFQESYVHFMLTACGRPQEGGGLAHEDACGQREGGQKPDFLWTS